MPKNVVDALHDASMVTEIPENSREVLRVMLQSFKGHDLCGIRVRFKDRDDGVLKPGTTIYIRG